MTNIHQEERIAIDGPLRAPITLIRGDYLLGLSEEFFTGLTSAEHFPMIRLWDEGTLGLSETIALVLKDDDGKVYERADITVRISNDAPQHPEQED